MRRWLPIRDHPSLPIEIYASSVDALYGDSRSLYAGTISAALAAGVTAWKTGEIPFLLCSALLTLIGVARAFDMAAYARQRPKPHDLAEIRRWEVHYIIGSGLFVAVLSAWCFLTFALTSDPAVHLISFSVSLAYLVGITGRNFSSDQLVITQTLCAAVPMIGGLLIDGNPYYAFLASLLIPFFLSIRFISSRLRKTLFEAVIATKDVQSLAQRFDTALNNMPHGLCMLDGTRRLVVANHRFGELMGLDPDMNYRDMNASDLEQKIIQANLPIKSDAERFAAEFEKKLSSASRQTLVIEPSSKKTLELTFQPMESGGCVILAEDITARREAAEKIEHLACYDALTGLPNRSLFQEELEKILGQKQPEWPHALLFIDLDQFKQVNDTLGHPAGDALLCQVADRLRRSLHSASIIARFGGDEFVVLQSLRRGRQEAVRVGERVIRELGRLYEVHGHQVDIGASVGIAIAPEDGQTFEQILKCADMALYRAKAEGRGTCHFFEPDMDRLAQARRTLELDIRNALANDEFELHFQPIVDIKSGRTTVCEALLRWPHPKRGMVPPAEFIPVAEEMGVIVELGNWVLRKACAECAKWPANIGVAVNMSPIQFRRSDVAATVADSLEHAGLAASRLEIEITESVLLEDIPAVHEALKALRQRGVQISLDDFGTGYSSLSYLRRFPLNKIKIDRTFLMGAEANSRSIKLLYGVARLSAELGMMVAVEGIETHQQLTLLLQEPSITQVQGFLFSKAVPSAEIRERLRKEKLEMTDAA